MAVFRLLVSLMCITMVRAAIWSWMVRDPWRDRFNENPTSLAFLFRLMIATIAWIAVLRCLPEAAFTTCYGEVTRNRMGRY